MCDLADTLTDLHIAAAGLHSISWHSKQGYNNRNPGLYVRTKCDLQIGAYHNSERRLTVYAAKAWQNEWGFMTLGAETGYASHPIPMASAGLKSEPLGVPGFRLAVIPKFGKLNDSWVVHVMYEVNLQ